VQPQVAAEGGKKRLVSSSKLTGGFYSTGQPCSPPTFLRNVSGHGGDITPSQNFVKWTLRFFSRDAARPALMRLRSEDFSQFLDVRSVEHPAAVPENADRMLETELLDPEY
jgi:hypothetical protein